ncbi:DUF802 domain-containing protein [Luteimonas sp. Y-2-2-4F]|nr:DUF802 domain-containing protein [Luteimonas sp. Y-2-2-4F]MCD9031223.1 DUF802 domain-containing protein [Luteimonas sp. Y-2-2-4F]
MHRHLLDLAVFLAGLVAVCWIGAGYAGANPLALGVVALILACYLAGALELHRYRQATATLERAVADLSGPPPALGDWLDRLHPSLRNAVRLRIEGERAALPAPALAPYLVGLLVLLGMLGTLLGMMATLRGTGSALQSASDLAAIRAALSAPVAGLAFAFGTSIAGVAASAMLGLLAALRRRDRMQAVRALDAKIATALRVHSQAHQREEAFRLLQRQAEAMPALVDRLQAAMAAIERQSADAGERQSAGQQAFHERTEAVYARLASSVERSLQESVAGSARAAGAALQPAVETTMAALSREAASLHETVARSVQRQLDALTTGFETSTATVAERWDQALAGQQRANETLARDLREALDGFAGRFEQRSAALLEGLSVRLDAAAARVTDDWRQALARQEDAHVADAERHAQALATASAAFEAHAASLVAGVDEAQARLQAALAAQDRERLSAWTEALAGTGRALREDWAQAGAQAAQRQQAICDTLERTAAGLAERTQAQARETIAETSRLLQAAAEAPKAAAEVVAELRAGLSESMARDTAMLEERNQLMATLGTLLDAVNHASTEQRTAVDALVATSADLLDRVGGRFDAQVGAGTGRLDAAAAQVAAGAVEVASLGEALGAAVASFGESSGLLAERLQRVEDALEKSLARSDEQLAYYVAQAREVVDLSMLAQRQIVEDLQQLAGSRAAAAAEAA